MIEFFKLNYFKTKKKEDFFFKLRKQI